MSQSSYDILNNIADRLEADIARLQEIEQIVKNTPELLERNPRLKELIKLAA